MMLVYQKKNETKKEDKKERKRKENKEEKKEGKQDEDRRKKKKRRAREKEDKNEKRGGEGLTWLKQDTGAAEESSVSMYVVHSKALEAVVEEVYKGCSPKWGSWDGKSSKAT